MRTPIIGKTTVDIQNRGREGVDSRKQKVKLKSNRAFRKLRSAMPTSPAQFCMSGLPQHQPLKHTSHTKNIAATPQTSTKSNIGMLRRKQQQINNSV